MRDLRSSWVVHVCVTTKGVCGTTNLLRISGVFSFWVLSLRGTLAGPSLVRYPKVVSQVANNLLVLVACCTDALSLSVQVLSSCRNTTEVLNVSRRSIVTQPFCLWLVLLRATRRSTGISSYLDVAKIFVITDVVSWYQ